MMILHIGTDISLLVLASNHLTLASPIITEANIFTTFDCVIHIAHVFLFETITALQQSGSASSSA